MPTYEYYCIANNQTVGVIHGMDDSISTWGDLCESAGIEQGDTPEDTAVTKKLSAISLLSNKGERGDSGGCCGGGGGCGCGGH